MTDLACTIIPKSDQINADDLITGPRTITITRVSADPGSAEQPIAVHFEGDGGKPYKPCKSMRRVMVAIWGPDGATYAGRSLTLYRDPKVMFGGMAVGGIRISHMSHLDSEMTIALTATKARRAPFTVRPLANAPRPPQMQAKLTPDQIIAEIMAATNQVALNEVVAKRERAIAWLQSNRPDAYKRVSNAVESRAFARADDFPDDLMDDESEPAPATPPGVAASGHPAQNPPPAEATPIEKTIVMAETGSIRDCVEFLDALTPLLQERADAGDLDGFNALQDAYDAELARCQKDAARAYERFAKALDPMIAKLNG